MVQVWDQLPTLTLFERLEAKLGMQVIFLELLSIAKIGEATNI